MSGNNRNRKKKKIFLELLAFIVVCTISSSHVITELATACFIQVQSFKYSSVSHFLSQAQAHKLVFQI